MLDVLERTDSDTRTVTEDGDHDKFSHYVKRDEQVEAMVMGTPIRAICGKLWVPTEIDNTIEKRQVCPACKEIAEGLDD